jgi:hypothetical protein
MVSGGVFNIPSGKRLHNYGKSPFIVNFPMKNSGSFHSYVNVYQRVIHPLVNMGMDQYLLIAFLGE